MIARNVVINTYVLMFATLLADIISKSNIRGYLSPFFCVTWELASIGGRSPTTQKEKGDDHRKAMMKPTPRRGKQRDHRNGSKRQPPNGRWLTHRRAMNTRQRRREQKNNPKQPKKNYSLFCA